MQINQTKMDSKNLLLEPAYLLEIILRSSEASLVTRPPVLVPGSMLAAVRSESLISRIKVVETWSWSGCKNVE